MASISTPDLSDAAPEARAIELQFRNYGARQAFGGPAVTIKCFEDNSLVRDAVKSEGRGRVLVVDGGGSLRRALLGDLLAAAAAENGWQGLLINGCVRDVEILQTIGLGVKALNSCPVKTDKLGEGQSGVDVKFAGCTIRPGRYLYSDSNGVVVASRDLRVDY